MKYQRCGGGLAAAFLIVVGALVLGSLTPAVASAPTPTPTTTAAVTPGHQLAQLARLLTELEENIKDSTQTDDWGAWGASRIAWRNRLIHVDPTAPRTGWTAGLTAVDPTCADLTAALQALELSLRPSALAADWQTGRIGWYTALRRATIPAEIAELMKQLELPLPWEAMETAWKTRRDGWLAEVRAAGGIGSSAAPAPTNTATATTAASIARVAELLSSLEQSVKPESMGGQWAAGRAAWAATLQRAASVADLKAALQEFEVSIKTGAQEISTIRRTEWYTALRAATTPAHLAVRLRELEATIKIEAMVHPYQFTRYSWYKDVNEVANGTYVPAAPAPTAPAPTTAPAPGGNIPKLAALLKELEAATVYQAQVSDWSDRRGAWMDAAGAAATVAQLRESLLAYEASLKPESLLPWASPESRRSASRDLIRAAATGARLGELLRELEADLTKSSVTDSWPGRRDGWLAEVRAAGTGVAAAAPVPSPAVPAPTASTPAPTTVAAVSGNIPHLAALLKELEAATNLQAQESGWSDRRPAWQSAVVAATTLAQLRESLLAYERSLKTSAFGSLDVTWFFRSPRWEADLRTATTAGQWAGLLKEMEAALITSSFTPDWPGRREAWRAEVAGAGGGAAAPVPSPAAPATPVAASAHTIPFLVNHLIDLESRISYAAQAADWKDRQREAWIVEVKGATTVNQIGTALLTLELGIRPESFRSHWSARRMQWRSEIQTATTATKMDALIVEIENSLAYSAWISNDDSGDWY